MDSILSHLAILTGVLSPSILSVDILSMHRVICPATKGPNMKIHTRDNPRPPLSGNPVSASEYSLNKAPLCNNGLTRLITAKFLYHLFFTFSVCAFQDNSESVKIPKNLTTYTLSILNSLM